jgi:hypothetical protein
VANIVSAVAGLARGPGRDLCLDLLLGCYYLRWWVRLSLLHLICGELGKVCGDWVHKGWYFPKMPSAAAVSASFYYCFKTLTLFSTDEVKTNALL